MTTLSTRACAACCYNTIISFRSFATPKIPQRALFFSLLSIFGNGTNLWYHDISPLPILLLFDFGTDHQSTAIYAIKSPKKIMYACVSEYCAWSAQGVKKTLD